jgi:hypothetical protein
VVLDGVRRGHRGCIPLRNIDSVVSVQFHSVGIHLSGLRSGRKAFDGLLKSIDEKPLGPARIEVIFGAGGKFISQRPEFLMRNGFDDPARVQMAAG